MMRSLKRGGTGIGLAITELANFVNFAIAADSGSGASGIAITLLATAIRAAARWLERPHHGVFLRALVG